MRTTASADAMVSEHRPYLLRFARRRLADAALVEDVVQDTLLAAWQGFERFEQKAALRTWLTGILLNKIADSVRRERRAAPGAADAEDGEADGDAVVDADDEMNDEAIEWRDPSRLLESRQFVELLHSRLDALSPLAARAFTLREIDGLSLDEIARELGISAGHSAVLLHRTRNRLREGLERQLGRH